MLNQFNISSYFFVFLGLVAFIPRQSEAQSMKNRIGKNAPLMKITTGKVQLLSAGKKPHAKLQYRLKQASKYRMRITMHMSMDMKIQVANQAPIPRKVNIPPMELLSSIECLSNKKGITTLRVKLLQAKPIKTPGMSPQMVKAFKATLHTMNGLSMLQKFSPHGVLLSSRIENMPKVRPQLMQLMNNIQNTFRQIATPLPKEAIGAGAVWQVNNQLLKPVKLQQKITYKLLKKQGSFLRISVKVSQSANNQIQKIASPQGKVKLNMSIASKGQGTNTIKLNQLWIRSGLHILSNMRVRSLAAKQSQKVFTKMSIKTYVRSNSIKR